MKYSKNTDLNRLGQKDISNAPWSAYCNELGCEERLLSRACKYTHRQHTAPKKIDCLSILVNNGLGNPLSLH